MKLTVANGEIEFEVDGPTSAPAVLLWNGAGCTLRMWDLAVDRLKETFCCVRFDVRGVGKSLPAVDDDGQYTFQQYASDANAILDSLGIEHCYVWSMAWGSRAAIAYASLWPERVIAAAFFDANVGPADVKAQRAGHGTAVERQRSKGIEPFSRPNGWNTHENPQEVTKAMAAARKFDYTDALSRLTMPVLVATGDHDPNLPGSREIAAGVAGARIVIMENVGHGSVLQRPDLTTRMFREFIADAC